MTPQWLAINEPSLEEIAASDLAVISRPGKVRSLVQVICRRRAGAQKLVREFGGVARVLPRNWLEFAHKQETHAPIRIGRRLEIVSEPARSSKVRNMPLLVIPAAGVWDGRTCDDRDVPSLAGRDYENVLSWRLLDAELARRSRSLRGVSAPEKFWGLDRSQAVAHARQNARSTAFTARFIAADLLQWKPITRYEVVTANLFGELLIAALRTFRRTLCARGCLIASGVLREQAESVARALRRARFHLEKQRRRGKWIALLATRKT